MGSVRNTYLGRRLVACHPPATTAIAPAARAPARAMWLRAEESETAEGSAMPPTAVRCSLKSRLKPERATFALVGTDLYVVETTLGVADVYLFVTRSELVGLPNI